jgi:hypothetical protein
MSPIGTSTRQSAAVTDNASTERTSGNHSFHANQSFFMLYKVISYVAIDSGTSGIVPSQAPTTEMLTNNVESFSGKEGKNRNFRGPSDGGGAFEQRASFGQVKAFTSIQKIFLVAMFHCCFCFFFFGTVFLTKTSR